MYHKLKWRIEVKNPSRNYKSLKSLRDSYSFIIMISLLTLLNIEVKAQDSYYKSIVLVSPSNYGSKSVASETVDYSAMKNTISLSISGGFITEIPEGVFKLNQLEELSINSNELSIIQPGIKKIKQPQNPGPKQNLNTGASRRNAAVNAPEGAPPALYVLGLRVR